MALARRHDASRILQTGVKYGSAAQRRALAAELRGEFRALAESRFAKFLVGKLLARGDEAVRDAVVPEFFGGVRRLIRHPEAAWIVDDVYRGAATSGQKARMLREWYGAEFVVFDAQTYKSGPAPTAELGVILAESPGKRGPAMSALLELINALVQKRTTAFTMLHDAMLQYYVSLPVGSDEATDFMELLKSDEAGDLLKNLSFTASGARVVSLAIARGTAKDRKQIIKTYKGVIRDLAADANGVSVLLTALDVIDDTVLTSKTIYGELFPSNAASELSKAPRSDKASSDPMVFAATHAVARLPLLFPLVRDAEAMLHKLPAALAIYTETQRIRETTSKKDPSLRRTELARALTAPILACITRHAPALVRSGPPGCTFIADALLGAPVAAATDRDAALQELAELTADSAAAADMTATTARMLKALVLSGRFDARSKQVVLAEPRLGFADRLYGVWTVDGAAERAGGDLSFVVVGLLESEDFGRKEELRAALKRDASRLREQAASGGNKGTQLVLKMVDG